ncbi:Lrp/AsnC family transcriptional regulator [Candidatus Woesearchaeota archaeon]|nr:Lrp/AsnC family transcriptional regulator [Candidatus Woesearchaeota archaeon]
MNYTPDEKDKKILEILEEHADYPTRKIAKKTLLPITTVHNRITKLRKEGIIKKFTIELDYAKVDLGQLAYILVSTNLQALREKKRTQYDVVKEIKRLGVVRADIVSGGTDIVVIVRVKDVSAYDKFLLGKLQKIEGIDKTQTLMVIH